MKKWLKTSLGADILMAETVRCRELIPSGYYARALQVGISDLSYLEGLETRERYIIDMQEPLHSSQWKLCSEQLANNHYVVSNSCALPFPERSQNIIILPHTLDFCNNPHEVLRQVNQILEPEGCLVVIGFNQYSIYGGIRLIRKNQQIMPWNGKYYRVGRVQDWLSLLGFDLVGAGMIAYQPPFQSEKWRLHLAFIEKAGDRWWPGFGGIYIIVGRKREMAVTPRHELAGPWYNLLPGIVQPAAQRAARLGLRQVINNKK